LNQNKEKDCDLILVSGQKEINKSGYKDNKMFINKKSASEYIINVKSSQPMNIALNEVFLPSVKVYSKDIDRIMLFDNLGAKLLFLNEKGEYNLILQLSDENKEHTDWKIYAFWTISAISILFTIFPWIKLATNKSTNSR
jgi:hypothetical protein